VEEVTGLPHAWFFDQVYRSSNTFDYAIERFDSEALSSRGLTESPAGLAFSEQTTQGSYRTTVVVRRLDAGVFPVDVLVTFSNGEQVREAWDGRARWQAFTFDRPVKAGRLERFVAIATDAGAEPLVVLTKADLVDDPGAAAAEVRAAVPGVEVVTLATKAGRGVPELVERARDTTVVLVGESGAGKSTLVNALIGDEVAATGDVRATDAKGRHTTTSRNLHLLPHGGVLIDTPGIRSVGLWTDAETVAVSFTDVEELAERCRFRDCAHGNEPGCAVRAAVEAGDLDQRRLAAWISMCREADAAMVRAEEHARRKAERTFGKAVREAGKRKGRGR